MTKYEFLEKLISKKDTWQVTMPIFKEQNETFIIHKGICYQGAFQINIDEDVLFECLVESLKGIIIPITEFVSMKSPVVDYIINPEQLKVDYVYEDQLTCYYPGGKTTVDFRFIVIEEDISEPEDISIVDKVKQKNVKKKDELTIQLSKLTFGIDETIKLNIINETQTPRHLLFECKQDFLTPNITEVFLNDQWTQEWYFKKTMGERLFGNLSFRNEPFKEMIIKGFIDHEYKASYVLKASVTVYEEYETYHLITDERMYKNTKNSVFRHYIEGLVNASTKREASNLLDLIKACLNFNQLDLKLRLFYIWVLLEFGHKKEVKAEMSLIEKYENYYSVAEEYPLIKILKSIVNKDRASIDAIFEGIDESSTWLELLAKARHTVSRNNRYSYYKVLYNKGIRKSFLFAEVASLLNQLPIIPGEDDELYIVTLKWAFNKKGVSSSWLNKLDRHYYQLEKNLYMTSSVAKELYNLKKSKNFLRLFCQLCIREERYDYIAFKVYKEALKSQLYIQDLENYYIHASWKTKSDIDLDLMKYFVKIQYMDKPIRDYIYLSVIKKRATFVLVYNRLYDEIISYIKNVDYFSLELIQLISIMFEEFMEDKKTVIFDIMTITNIKTMKDFESGNSLIGKFFDFCMSANCWIENIKKQQIVYRIIDIIGFEGLNNIYNNKEKVVKYFDVLNSKHRYNGNFLNNELYLIRNESLDLLTNIYKKIIIDDFIENLITHYFELSDNEKSSIKKFFFYYIGRRIVVEFEEVGDLFLEEMCDYYISLETKPSWLLLALIKGLNTTNDDLTNRIRNLYVEGQKHDIIVPWFNEGVFDENVKTIHYLSHPNDDIMIYYRFNENEEFLIVKMKHIAFGVFIHRIKLFYGEYFDYYIVIKDSNGDEYIPHSDLIVNKIISQNSLFTENDYSVESRIDNITLSYELNDDLSAKVFIDEQIEFKERIKRLLKV